MLAHKCLNGRAPQHLVDKCRYILAGMKLFWPMTSLHWPLTFRQMGLRPQSPESRPASFLFSFICPSVLDLGWSRHETDGQTYVQTDDGHRRLMFYPIPIGRRKPLFEVHTASSPSAVVDKFTVLFSGGLDFYVYHLLPFSLKQSKHWKWRMKYITFFTKIPLSAQCQYWGW